jgi:hypothetical protein
MMNMAGHFQYLPHIYEMKIDKTADVMVLLPIYAAIWPAWLRRV